jgi:hypothetical protein
MRDMSIISLIRRSSLCELTSISFTISSFLLGGVHGCKDIEEASMAFSGCGIFVTEVGEGKWS